MSDQADKLRQLVIDTAPARGDRMLPPTIVVTGGKGGVGATTVAINLAAALAEHGRRTVLVDAAPNADVAQLLGIDVERGSRSKTCCRGNRRGRRARRGAGGNLAACRPMGGRMGTGSLAEIARSAFRTTAIARGTGRRAGGR